MVWGLVARAASVAWWWCEVAGFALAARLLLAAVFLVAGVAKLVDRAGTMSALEGFGVPTRVAVVGARVLPVVEWLIAGALLVRTTSWWGAAASLALFTVFAAAIGRVMARGEAPDCHCFGQLHSAPAGWGSLAGDLVLASVAAFVAVAGWSDPGPSAIGWVAGVGPGPLIATAAGVLLAAVLGFQVWFSLQLLHQNGRLVLRLDSIEKMLADDSGLKPAPLAPTGPTAPGLAVGDIAPAFSLPDVRGKAVTLAGLRALGLPLLLVFHGPGRRLVNAPNAKEQMMSESLRSARSVPGDEQASPRAELGVGPGGGRVLRWLSEHAGRRCNLHASNGCVTARRGVQALLASTALMLVLPAFAQAATAGSLDAEGLHAHPFAGTETVNCPVPGQAGSASFNIPAGTMIQTSAAGPN
jgi:hypothetical protein